MKCRVKVRDGPESVGLPDLEVECRVGGLEAQSALQTGMVESPDRKRSASHLRASEMRMRREQRLLPFASRGTSRAHSLKREECHKIGSTWPSERIDCRTPNKERRKLNGRR